MSNHERSSHTAHSAPETATIHPLADAAIVHPEWCEPEACTQDVSRADVIADVYHRTAPMTWRAGDLSIELGMCRIDNYDDTDTNLPTFLATTLSGYGEATLKEIEGLSAWLTLRTAAFRKAIESEGHR